MAAGEIGQQATGLGEGHVVAAAAGLLSEALGDHRLSDADRPVQDDRLAGLDKAERSQVSDTRSGDLRVEREVEVLDGTALLEVCGAHPAGDAGGVTPCQLVLAEHLQELDVAELAGTGLGETHLQGVEHPRQRERAERRLELVRPHWDTSSRW